MHSSLGFLLLSDAVSDRSRSTLTAASGLRISDSGRYTGRGVDFASNLHLPIYRAIPWFLFAPAGSRRYSCRSKQWGRSRARPGSGQLVKAAPMDSNAKYARRGNWHFISWLDSAGPLTHSSTTAYQILYSKIPCYSTFKNSSLPKSTPSHQFHWGKRFAEPLSQSFLWMLHHTSWWQSFQAARPVRGNTYQRPWSFQTYPLVPRSTGSQIHLSCSFSETGTLSQ